MIETSSSWCLNTGGMSLKDAGVDAISVLCSSGEMNFGSSFIMTMGAILLVVGEAKRWQSKADLDL